MTRYALDNVDWSDDLSYVREMYGVPAKEGMRVKYNGNFGMILRGEGPYIVVRLEEGDREPVMLHPTWRIDYL